MIQESLFKPCWWLKSPHLQTLWGPFCKSRILVNTRAERIELPDGDFIDLAWAGENNHGPLVLILHGLSGNVHSHYVGGILKILHSQGFRTVFMHFRGCSNEPNRLIRSFHAGETQDLSYIINVIIQRYPHLPLIAIGYSLGGNILLKWLGETGKNNPLQAAVAVSVPFLPARSSLKMQHGAARIYQVYFLSQLRRFYWRKSQILKMPFAYHEVAKIKTLWDWDDRVTAPLHGFRDAKDYYYQSASHHYLNKIYPSTLIIQALDDPMIPRESLPKLKELSASITLELSQQGGHLGFITARSKGPIVYFLEERICAFIRKYFQVTTEYSQSPSRSDHFLQN